MNRSGYVGWDYDDSDYPLALYRQAVDCALDGKRGQEFLRSLIGALDALPEKKLIEGELERDGEYCALGAVARARGIKTDGIDTYDREQLSEVFGIAPSMAAEIMWINDEKRQWDREAKRWQEINPETRFASVREWAVAHIRPEVSEKP